MDRTVMLEALNLIGKALTESLDELHRYTPPVHARRIKSLPGMEQAVELLHGFGYYLEAYTRDALWARGSSWWYREEGSEAAPGCEEFWTHYGEQVVLVVDPVDGLKHPAVVGSGRD